MLCTRKREKQTNEKTSQKQYAPPPHLNFFQSWGHKNIVCCSCDMHFNRAMGRFSTPQIGDIFPRK